MDSLYIPRTHTLRRTCGTDISQEKLVLAEADFAAKRVSAKAPAAASIKVYWHVVSKDSNLSGGNIPYARFSVGFEQKG